MSYLGFILTKSSHFFMFQIKEQEKPRKLFTHLSVNIKIGKCIFKKHSKREQIPWINFKNSLN